MYHAPDRSDAIRNFSKAEDDDLDIDWADGVLATTAEYVLQEVKDHLVSKRS